jgi:hypothetical protein
MLLTRHLFVVAAGSHLGIFDRGRPHHDTDTPFGSHNPCRLRVGRYRALWLPKPALNCNAPTAPSPGNPVTTFDVGQPRNWRGIPDDVDLGALRFRAAGRVKTTV